jgi:cysteine desulfurase
MDCIYLDNNATTPMLSGVIEALRPYLAEIHGNPASAHQFGRRARQALEDAREQAADLLGAHPDEVIFTSGATEGNNLAIFGLVGAAPGGIIASAIEHPSVAEPVQRLRESGFRVDYLPVDSEGVVRTEALRELLGPQTSLLTVMLANHETGAVQPVRALVDQTEGSVPIHCDAAQAIGKIPVDFHDLGVSSLSISAHKFHGPMGVGALLVRRDVKVRPHLWGGHQQRGRRPGTEAVALAVGMAAALDLAYREMNSRWAKVERLRTQFLHRLEAAHPLVINGPRSAGLPYTLNVSFPGLRAEVLLMALDLSGVACSAGSACSSGSLLPSPVLRAMGVSEHVFRSAIRFSFSALLTEEDADEAGRRVAEVVQRLRCSTVE